MYDNNQFISLKKHLKDRYLHLLEKSNNYRFEDEAKSDLAAYKAMRILEKINQFHYFDREATV